MRNLFLSLVLVAGLLSAGQASAAVAVVNRPGGGPGGSNGTPANVIVITNVVNDDQGSLLPASFLMTYGDGLATLNSFPGYAAPGFNLTVQPGNYVVEGPNMPGYVRSYSGDCSGTLVAGGFATCTVTYDDAEVPVPATCGMTSCDPVTPPDVCPSGSPDCAGTPNCGSTDCGTTPPVGGCPVGTDCSSATPPDTASCDPLDPTCAASGAPELPRTGGLPVLPLVLTAAGAALSFRKRS